MSVPSPYQPRGAAAAEPREDCRDYLRTGRCKYGASCKYNHPPNVQSGGGMRAPVDPNEPMFPIRPNEPVCQYYMKHGTCKFGQACKFHHPPQSSVTAALVGGGTVVMNVGRKSDMPQIVMNSIAADGTSTSTPMMLQFLPQRPDEQDCIFFLKNGRCKYGATCRYHHPINFSQRRPDEARRRVQVQQVPESFLQHANVQFVSHPGNSQVSYQQGPSSSSGTHMVVTDGPVAYMTVDGTSGKGSYQQLSVVSNDGYCAPTGAPISHNQDHTSSTSSIASSYDTAASNLDHLVPHIEQSSGMWNRQKNNGSHASLNAYDSAVARQRMPPMPQSTSEGNIASRRHRAASYGSASENGVYLDASGSIKRATKGGVTIPTSSSQGAMSSWQTERAPSLDNVMRGNPGHYRQSNGQRGDGQSQELCRQSRRPPAAGGRRRSSEAVDAGLSMMTSALLTMLDTPEEAVGEEGYEYDYEDIEHHEQMPPSSLPAGEMVRPGSQGFDVVPRLSGDGEGYHPYTNSQSDDPDFLGSMTVNSPVLASQYQDPQGIHSDEASGWLPNWQRSKSVGRSLEGDAQSMSVMQAQHSTPSASPQHSSDVGLFLP